MLELMFESLDSKSFAASIYLKSHLGTQLDAVGALGDADVRLAGMGAVGGGGSVHNSGVSLEDVSNLLNDVVMVSGQSKVCLSITMMVDETMLDHNSVQLGDGTLGLSGGMSDDRVELVDKSVVLNQRVHPG